MPSRPAVDRQLRAKRRGMHFTFTKAADARNGKWECCAKKNATDQTIAILKKVNDRRFKIYISGGCIVRSTLDEAIAIIESVAVA